MTKPLLGGAGRVGIKYGCAAFACRDARYCFHVRRGDVTVFDREGVELTGIAEAKPRGGVAARDAEISASLGAGRIIIEEGWRTVLERPF